MIQLPDWFNKLGLLSEIVIYLFIIRRTMSSFARRDTNHIVKYVTVSIIPSVTLAFFLERSVRNIINLHPVCFMICHKHTLMLYSISVSDVTQNRNHFRWFQSQPRGPLFLCAFSAKRCIYMSLIKVPGNAYTRLCKVHVQVVSRCIIYMSRFHCL